MRLAVVRSALAGLAAVVALAPAAGAIETARYGMEPSPAVVDGDARTNWRIDLAAGGSARDAVRVFNKSDEELTLRVYATDAQRSGESIAPGASPGGRTVGRWVSFEDDTVTLAPRRSAVVPFTLEGPEEYPEGPTEFVGAIVVEPVVEQGSTVAVVERLATAVYVTPSAGVAGRIARSPITWIALALLLIVVVMHGQVAALLRRRR